MEDRLQKILARAGFGSRRANEELITQGRVTVNGQIAALGAKADPATDKIAVDGKLIKLEEQLVYIALFKPRGVISAVESPDPRRTVRDLVPVSERVYPVGRLDADSEGLILLTNDGDLANRLTHPRFGHQKEYRVLVARQPDQEQLNAWRHGVVLEEGYRTQPAQVQIEQPFGKGAWLRVILQEGRKRQIREMGAQTGLPVVRIVRTRIGTLQLGHLKPGEWRHLSEQEVDELKGKRSSAAGTASSRAAGTRQSRTTARPPRKAPTAPAGRASKRPPASGSTEKPRRRSDKPPGGKPGLSSGKPSRPQRPTPRPPSERRAPPRPQQKARRK